MGTNTFSTTDNALAANIICLTDDKASNVSVSVKYLMKEKKPVIKIGGTYAVPNKPMAIIGGLTSNLKVTTIVAGVVPPSYCSFVGGQVQGQIGASYCPTTGVAFNLGFEINEP